MVPRRRVSLSFGGGGVISRWFLPGDGKMLWTPSDDPDPSDVLLSASADTRDAAHADALAKFLWFHHNALRYDWGLTAVRRSFGLAGWMELADVYPPARAAYVRTRDEAEAALAADPENYDLFCDVAALNRYLGEGLRTADAFARVARQSPEAAAGVYHVAEPFLLAAGRYGECGPFLDPPGRLWVAGQAYEVMSRREAGRSVGEDQPPRLARTFFVRDIATLVGLLALNRRAEEAGRVRGEALAVVDDEEFRALLDAAMSGHLPPSDPA